MDDSYVRNILLENYGVKTNHIALLCNPTPMIVNINL